MALFQDELQSKLQHNNKELLERIDDKLTTFQSFMMKSIQNTSHPNHFE